MVSQAAFLRRRPLLLALLAVPCSASALVEAVHSGNPNGFLQKKDAAQSDSDSGGPFDDAVQPSCSCDCCDTVHRLPGEMSFGAAVKCSASGAHSEDMCGAQCTPSKEEGKEDKVLPEDVVDMERFCFFECKPAAGGNAPVKSQCVAFSEDEAARTIDPAGNPMDPAFLYAVAPKAGPGLSNQRPASFFNGAPIYSAAAASANLLSTRTRVDPPEYESTDKTKKAKIEALKGKASSETEAGHAQLEAARLRQMEHIKQKELHAALKESGDGVVTLDPFAAIQDLSSAAMNARVSAEKAAITAGKAVKAYDMGRRKIWKLALGEAGKEVLRWKKHAEDLAAANLKAMYAPTWQSKAMAKAQKASAPYIEAMLRAQESVKLYNQKGYATADSASALWKEAQADGDKANKLPRGSIAENNLAQSDMLDAREKAKQAQSMAMESRQYFATAAEVRKGIPQFQYSAQKAAAAAVAAMNMPR